MLLKTEQRVLGWGGVLHRSSPPFLCRRGGCSQWDFISNAARRKATKWLSVEGMGDACKERTEQWGAGEELKTST